jgi:membrane protein required for colicin V production
LNWVDIIVLAVIGLSAVLACMRGFVREVMGVGAWIGAAVVAVWGGPEVEPKVNGLHIFSWTIGPEISGPVAYGVVFLGALLLLSIVATLVGGVVRGSALGGIDRSLGVVYGLVRGGALIVVAYILASLVVQPDRWPEPVREARSMQFAGQGAAWLVRQLPKQYQPQLPPLPIGFGAHAADLLQLPAQGRPGR